MKTLKGKKTMVTKLNPKMFLSIPHVHTVMLALEFWKESSSNPHCLYGPFASAHIGAADRNQRRQVNSELSCMQLLIAAEYLFFVVFFTNNIF